MNVTAQTYRQTMTTERSGSRGGRLGQQRDQLVRRIGDVGGSLSDRTRQAVRRTALTRDDQALISMVGPGEPSADVGASEITGSPADEDWGLVLAVATFLMAAVIAHRNEGSRAEKMARVVERLHDSLAETIRAAGGDPEAPDPLLAATARTWPHDDRVRLLIDLDFGDPFFPYELDVRQRDFEFALRAIAASIGIADGTVDEIRETRRSANAAHRSVNLTKIAVFGAGGVLLVGTGAFALAPFIGAAIGGAAGLSGAAATSYGLAILGGGTLATGGAGMAGGLWLVTGVGAAAGLLGGSGSAALYELGAAQARAELTRLQVTFKMTVLSNQLDTLKAQQVIGSLHEQLDTLQATLADEQRLNERNARRVKDLVATITAVEESISWMESEQGASA